MFGNGTGPRNGRTVCVPPACSMRTTTRRSVLCLLVVLAQPKAATASYGRGTPGRRRQSPAAASSSAPAAAENAPLPLSPNLPNEGGGFNPAGELQVTYATEGRCIEEWFARECGSGAAVLGFDTETRPSYQKGQVYPTATLQIATASAVLVVHLLHLDAMPAVLVDALASEATLKIGVGVDEDAIDLWLHHGLEVNGRLDLTHAAVASETASDVKSLGGTRLDRMSARNVRGGGRPPRVPHASGRLSTRAQACARRSLA